MSKHFTMPTMAYCESMLVLRYSIRLKKRLALSTGAVSESLFLLKNRIPTIRCGTLVQQDLTIGDMLLSPGS
jgi:hypothetical protein